MAEIMKTILSAHKVFCMWKVSDITPQFYSVTRS